MSSGVTTQTLGYIWSLANKKCIGVLTEEELYLTMALIAISQVRDNFFFYNPFYSYYPSIGAQLDKAQYFQAAAVSNEFMSHPHFKVVTKFRV